MAFATPLPTMVLVSRAWYPPSSFSALTSCLLQSGYEVICASVPSIQSSSPMTADCASDANYLHDQYLQPLVETDDKDVIIVTHSYGAIPGSAAAMGSSKRSRTEQGKTGGVIGIVFMSAFVKENGSISDTMGGQWPPFIEKDAPSPGLCIITTLLQVLFPDAPTVIAYETASSMLPQAMLAYESPSPKPVWLEPGFARRCHHIRCVNDDILPAVLQDAFIATVGEGMAITVMQTGHSPHLSDPEGVTRIVTGHIEAVMKMQ